MQLRPDVILAGTIKSLRDVVAPALDVNNKLAQEQLAVGIGLLELLRARLPLEFRFDCDELARLLDFARTLAEAAHRSAGGDVAALEAAARDGAAVLERARAAPDEVQAAARALRAAGAASVTGLFAAGDADARAVLSRHVLDHAREQLLRDRAWTAPQGWEPAAKALPTIESLLGVDPAAPSA